MKRIMVWLFTLMLVLVLPATVKASSLQTSMIPEDTRWLFHFDISKFFSTELGELLMAEKTGKLLNRVNRKITKAYKMDLLKDIGGITIFGPGKDESKAVVAISGNFNKEYLLSLLGKTESHQKIQYGKHTIHRWHHAQCGTFANDHLLLIGRDESAIKNVLDVVAGKKKSLARGTMMSFIKEIPEDAFLKAVADNIASLIKDDAKAVLLKKTGMALFMALEKSGNLKLKLKLTTDTPETAQNIEQMVRGLIALARLKQQEEVDAEMKLIESLKITLKGNIIQMELSYPSAELVEVFSHGKEAMHLSF
jgi:hypothetical protein